MLGLTLGIILLGVELGPEDGFEELVGKTEATNVGSLLGATLGILLGVELGPEDGYNGTTQCSSSNVHAQHHPVQPFSRLLLG
jgi:hypothetical protein